MLAGLVLSGFAAGAPSISAHEDDPSTAYRIAGKSPKTAVHKDAPKLIWPTWSHVSSWFDHDHPLGIDMGLHYYPDSSIVASAEGVVSFAGGRVCCSYGLYVIVEHANGYSTLYAHLSRIDVQEGQKVRQGERLGVSGNTGLSTSEHLHFEVRHEGQRLDPMLYLPRDESPG